MALQDFFSNPLPYFGGEPDYSGAYYESPEGDHRLYRRNSRHFGAVAIVDVTKAGAPNGIVFIRHGYSFAHVASTHEYVQGGFYEIGGYSYIAYEHPDGMYLNRSVRFEIGTIEDSRTGMDVCINGTPKMGEYRAWDGDAYVLASPDGEKVRALPKKKYKPDAAPWDQQGWVTLRAGRYFRAMFPQLTDTNIEFLANRFKGRFSEPEFELVRGEDIRHWYHEDNNLDDGSSLASSCMRHPECQEYLGLYVENPNRVAMLISRRGDMIDGRALVWTLDDGRTLMDRVYGSDARAEGFKAYAKEQGWLCKQRQSYDYHDLVAPDGAILSRENVTVTLDKWEFDYWPFVDTLSMIDGRTLSIFGGGIRLDNTEGEMGDVDRIRCYECGDRIHDGDEWLGGGEYYCEPCFDRLFTYCEVCSEYVRNIEMTTLEGRDLCHPCYDNHAVNCDDCGDDFHVDNCHFTEDSEWLCQECEAGRLDKEQEIA